MHRYIYTFGRKGGIRGRGKQTSKHGGIVYFVYNSRFGKQNTEGLGGCVIFFYHFFSFAYEAWAVDCGLGVKM